MKAKFIYENILSPKSQKDIEDNISKLDIQHQLIAAVRSGMTERVRKIIQENPDINTGYGYGLLIAVAVEKNYHEILDMLLKTKIGFKAANDIGWDYLFSFADYETKNVLIKNEDNFKIEESVINIFEPKSEEEINSSFDDYLFNDKFVEPDRLIIGEVYYAQDLGPEGKGTGQFIPVVINSVDQVSGTRDFEVYVEDEEGHEDVWYVEENDPIFKKTEKMLNDVTFESILTPKSSEEIESLFSNMNNQEAFNRAAAKGLTYKVKELINKPNVDPNYLSGSAIYSAVQNGNAELVEFLLSDPRIFKFVNKHLSELLYQEATMNDRQDIIDILLKKGIV